MFSTELDRRHTTELSTECTLQNRPRVGLGAVLELPQSISWLDRVKGDLNQG